MGGERRGKERVSDYHKYTEYTPFC
jgi:hypothetical protein